MNGLDPILIAPLVLAAWKGFRRGLLIEAAALLGLVLGIWAGLRLSGRVVAALGLEVEGAAAAFLITFALVLAAVVLLGRLATAAADLAQLGLPNRIGGLAFGALRSAFALSVALNLLQGWSAGRVPSPQARAASGLFAPIRALAPMAVPALEDAPWMQGAEERIRQGLREPAAER